MQRKDNDGVLFKNLDKQNENHPDYKGSATVNGVEYWLSSWINESKNGTKYMSVKFKPKDDVQKQGVQQAYQATNQRQTRYEEPVMPGQEPVMPGQEGFEDDIPF